MPLSLMQAQQAAFAGERTRTFVRADPASHSHCRSPLDVLLPKPHRRRVYHLETHLLNS